MHNCARKVHGSKDCEFSHNSRVSWLRIFTKSWIICLFLGRDVLLFLTRPAMRAILRHANNSSSLKLIWKARLCEIYSSKKEISNDIYSLPISQFYYLKKKDKDGTVFSFFGYYCIFGWIERIIFRVYIFFSNCVSFCSFRN